MPVKVLAAKLSDISEVVDEWLAENPDIDILLTDIKIHAEGAESRCSWDIWGMVAITYEEV